MLHTRTRGRPLQNGRRFAVGDASAGRLVVKMLEFLMRFLITILVVILTLPLFLIVVTPLVLIGAFFAREPYFRAVKNGYRTTFELWRYFAEALPDF